LLTKIFKEYFEENERKWVEILKGVQDYIEKLRKERDYFLCKFKPSAQMDLKKILSNKDITLENLI
jgi:hypothetical protein